MRAFVVSGLLSLCLAIPENWEKEFAKIHEHERSESAKEEHRLDALRKRIDAEGADDTPKQPNPTSFLEEEDLMAPINEDMKALNRALNFPADQPSSLLETGESKGTMNARERHRLRFKAAQERMQNLRQAMAADTERVKEHAAQTAHSLMNSRPAFSLLQRNDLGRGAKMSDETRSFVNQLRAKQDAFMRHLEAHGLHIPGLHETGPMPGTSFAETGEDQMMPLPPAPARNGDWEDFFDSGPNSPRVVDAKLRGIEQKLRDDAKAFQDEADSGQRFHAPSSFIQTGGDDDEDGDDAGTDLLREEYHFMQHVRKGLKKDDEQFKAADKAFKDGDRKAKQAMEAWRKRHPHGKSGMHFVALKADDESPADASSFLQREAPAGGDEKPEYAAEDKLKKADADMKGLADEVHAESLKWKRSAEEAKRGPQIDFPESFLEENENQDTTLNDDLESNLNSESTLQEWAKHMSQSAEERRKRHASLMQELSYNTADHGPELNAKYGIHAFAGTPWETSFLQTGGTSDWKGVLTPGVLPVNDAQTTDDSQATTDSSDEDVEKAAKAAEQADAEADAADSALEKDDKTLNGGASKSS